MTKWTDKSAAAATSAKLHHSRANSRSRLSSSLSGRGATIRENSQDGVSPMSPDGSSGALLPMRVQYMRKHSSAAASIGTTSRLSASSFSSTRGASGFPLHASLVRVVYAEICAVRRTMVRMAGKVKRLEDAMRTIDEHKKNLIEKLEYYEQYLESISKSQEHAEKVESKGISVRRALLKAIVRRSPKATVVKFTHRQLEEMNIIVKSEVEKSMRSHVVFSFSSHKHGVYTVRAGIKGFTAVKKTILIDNLYVGSSATCKRSSWT